MKKRLEELLKTEGLTAVKFAEIMQIQPSSVSHILSGRNNPNFDFVARLLMRFPEINPDWIINGIGDIYRSNTTDITDVITNVTSETASDVTDVNTNKFDANANHGAFIEEVAESKEAGNQAQNGLFTNVNAGVFDSNESGYNDHILLRSSRERQMIFKQDDTRALDFEPRAEAISQTNAQEFQTQSHTNINSESQPYSQPQPHVQSQSIVDSQVAQQSLPYCEQPYAQDAAQPVVNAVQPITSASSRVKRTLRQVVMLYSDDTFEVFEHHIK